VKTATFALVVEDFVVGKRPEQSVSVKDNLVTGCSF
jgi:hypothetical protein